MQDYTYYRPKNKKQKKENKIMKNLLKNTIIAIFAVMIASFGVFSAFAQFDSIDALESKLARLDIEEKQLKKEICETTKKTANKKLEMFYAKTRDLQGEESKESLDLKSEWSCDEPLPEGLQ